jgi:hypothetical protein
MILLDNSSNIFIDLTMNDNIKQIFYSNKSIDKYFELDNNIMKLNLEYKENSYYKLNNIIINYNNEIKLGNLELYIGSYKIFYPLNLFEIIKSNNSIIINLDKLDYYGLGDFPIGALHFSFIKIEIKYEGNIESAILNYNPSINTGILNKNKYDIKMIDCDVVKSSSDVIITNLDFYNVANNLEIHLLSNINSDFDLESVMFMLNGIEEKNYNLEISSNKIVLKFLSPVNFNYYEKIKLALSFNTKKERELIIISEFNNVLKINNGYGNLNYLSNIKKDNERPIYKFVNNNLHSNIINNIIVDYIDFKYI